MKFSKDGSRDPCAKACRCAGACRRIRGAVCRLDVLGGAAAPLEHAAACDAAAAWRSKSRSTCRACRRYLTGTIIRPLQAQDSAASQTSFTQGKCMSVGYVRIYLLRDKFRERLKILHGYLLAMQSMN